MVASRTQATPGSKLEISQGGMKLGSGVVEENGEIRITQNIEEYRWIGRNVHNTPGIKSHAVKNPALALKIVTAVLNETNDRLERSDLYAKRGAIHFQMGNYEEALADVRQAHGISGHQITAGFEAEVLSAMGKHTEAAEKFMEAWSGMYSLAEYAEGSAIELGKAGKTMEAIERYNLAGSHYRGIDRLGSASMHLDQESITRMTLAVKQLLRRVTPEQVETLSKGISARAPSFVANVITEQRKLGRKEKIIPVDLSKVF